MPAVPNLCAVALAGAVFPLTGLDGPFRCHRVSSEPLPNALHAQVEG